MSSTSTAANLGYVILTKGQAVEDYPDHDLAGINENDKVVVLTDDATGDPLLIVGGANADLVTLFEEIASYVSDTLIAQPVVAKVGPSTTVLGTK